MASSCTNRYVLVKYKHVSDVYVYRTAKKKESMLQLLVNVQRVIRMLLSMSLLPRLASYKRNMLL